MNIDPSIVSLLKAAFFGTATILIIPKDIYRKLFVYAFLFGAIGDVIVVFLSTRLGLIRYMNMGPFSIFGLFPFWTPIAWMFTFMLFLYFLPTRKLFLYPYTAGFAGFGYLLGIVLQNLNAFQYLGINKYLAPVIFFAWFLSVALLFIHLEKVEIS